MEAKEKNEIEQQAVSVAKKVRISTVIESFLAIGFVVLVGLALMAYFYTPSRESFPGKVLEKFSYPIVSVDNGNFIYSSEIRENLDILKKFYESDSVLRAGVRMDFSTEEGKKRLKIKEKEVLNKEIENKVVEVLAKRAGITLDNETIKGYAELKIADKNFLGSNAEDFFTTFGWGYEKIKEKIIIPDMYAEKLKAKAYEEIVSDKKPKETIELARKELGEGKDFEEVAKKYSSGNSAKEGGDIGWIGKDQMAKEVSQWIFSSDLKKKGEFEIIESQLGYHIIKVEEIKKENGVDMARIKQIFSRKKSFADWLDGKMKEMNIKVLVKDYYWDKEKSSVEFSDQVMRDFEEKYLKETLEEYSRIF